MPIDVDRIIADFVLVLLVLSGLMLALAALSPLAQWLDKRIGN